MKYSEHYTVRSYETDLNGSLKPTQLIQYMQETADHQMRDQDVDYDSLFYREHKAFVVSRMGVEIFAPIGKYEEIESRTWHAAGRAANFPRGYELLREGEVVAHAMSNWALVDTETGKLVMYRDYDMSGYAKDEPVELSIPSRVRLPRDASFREVDRLRVGRSLIDVNRHMNNAMYANMLYDYIPNAEDYFITSINIRFLREARYESEMTLYATELLDAGKADPRADRAIWFYTETEGEIIVESTFGLRALR